MTTREAREMSLRRLDSGISEDSKKEILLYEQMHKLAESLPYFLGEYEGELWEYDNRGHSESDIITLWWAGLTHPSGAEMHIRFDNKKTGKLSVHGYLMVVKGERNYSEHAIGVTLGRPAQVIATEIQRRLFPTYLPEYEASKKRFEVWEEKESLERRLTQEILKFGGYIGQYDNHFSWLKLGDTEFSGHVSTGENIYGERYANVQFNGSMPHSTFIALLDVLKVRAKMRVKELQSERAAS